MGCCCGSRAAKATAPWCRESSTNTWMPDDRCWRCSIRPRKPPRWCGVPGGQGPVFNVDERVYGCTSPLWVGWIAAAMRLGIDGLAWAKATGWIATLASVAVFLQLIRRSVPSPAVRAAATVAWAGHAWMLRWALSGMETPLAVLLVLGGFAAHAAESTDRPRGPWPGVLWGLAALVR